MKKIFFLAILTLLLLPSCRPSNGLHRLVVLSTNDVHGAIPSLFCAAAVIDSVRKAEGADNVLLIDAGDFLQGDNSVYYFNYVDTLSPHLCPRVFSDMGYDAVVVGNHDIETGHSVYDRVSSQMDALGIPLLAANAVREADGKPYFKEYALLRKAGLKVLVVGFTNAAIKTWLSKEIWEGMDFLSLLPMVQEKVDSLNELLDPDVTVVAVHSGTGEGDGSSLESQGRDLLYSLRGVDLVVCSHDHRPVTEVSDSICLINSGSRASKVAMAVLEMDYKGGVRLAKRISADLLNVDRSRPDTLLKARYAPDMEAVREFVSSPVTSFPLTLRSRDSFVGECPYMDLIHTVQLDASCADVSIASPLSFNVTLPAGDLIFKDMFRIYPYENDLCVVSMTGYELKEHLEASYGNWVGGDYPHVLKIVLRDDPKNGKRGWSFVNRSYNFDSAAGISYTVDVYKPHGERVKISCMADGSIFDPARIYRVAMNSYRVSGCKFPVLEKMSQVRSLIYRDLKEHGGEGAGRYCDRSRLGSWRFVPEAGLRAAQADMELLFASGK